MVVRREDLKKKKFFVPTIPYWWHVVASNLSGKSHAVGSQIWFAFKLSGGKFPVKLSRRWFDLMLFSRFTVERALVELEKAGLIQVKRHRGRAPIVKITTTESKVPDLQKEWAERNYH